MKQSSIDVERIFQSILASFPGSHVWAEKKEAGTHCLRMLSSPRILESVKSAPLLEFGDFCKICFVWHADSFQVKDIYHWPCSVWTVMRERWRQSSHRMQESSICWSIPAKMLWHVTDTIFPFKSLLITLNETMQTISIEATLKLPVCVTQGVW